jgi:hypothetical protein
VVCDEKHVEKLLQNTYDGVGLLTIASPTTPMRYARRASLNSEVQHDALLSLLWKSELLEIAKLFGFKKGLSKLSRQKLVNLISVNVDIKSTKPMILNSLITRKYDRLTK